MVAFTSYLWLKGHENLFGEPISSIFVLNLLNNTLPITAKIVLTEFSGPFPNRASVTALFIPLLGHEIGLTCIYVLLRRVNASVKR